LLQVLCEILKLQPLVILFPVSNLKNTNLTVIVEREFGVNSVLNDLKSNLALRIIDRGGLLNDGMSLDQDFDIWQ
jgi:hypothetical protein